MFKLLNKAQQSQKGQVAVVIVLVIAFALIFYAVTLNLGRVSDTKVATEIGANSGASYLASAMASYGHSLLMQQLGGERKKCSNTGFFKALISFIVVVILVVITIISYGGASAMTGPGIAAAVAAVAIAGAAVVIQMSIGAKITSAWNNLESQLLDRPDQFIASAMRSAIQVAGGDQKEVPDLYDLDMDRWFGFHPVTGQALDTIGRYTKYYGLILDTISINRLQAAEDFVVDLQDFIYQVPIDGDATGGPPDCYGNPPCGTGLECDNGTLSCQPAWALIDPLPGTFIRGLQTSTLNYSFTVATDPVNHRCLVDLSDTGPMGAPWNPVTDPFPYGSTLAPIPSECNICCVPATVPDPRGPAFGEIKVRPGCCDCRSQPATIDIEDPANPPNLITVPNPDFCDPNNSSLWSINGGPNLECGTVSTCDSAGPYGAQHPPTLTNFRWVFDANFENTENTFYSFRERLGKDDEHQLYHKDPDNPNWAPQRTPPWDGERYYVDDATGFYSGYVSPLPGAEAENRIGVFPLLWKLHDWGFDLDQLNTTGPVLPSTPVHDPFDQRCKWCDARGGTTCNLYLPYQMTQLLLRNDAITQSYDTSYCVDTYVDDVTLSITGSLEIDADTCYPSNYAGGPFWKRGADRFCSPGDISPDTSWPYDTSCAKYLNGNCTVNVSGDVEASICECEDPTSSSPADTAAINFPEDPLDEIIYNVHLLAEDYHRLASYSPGQLASRFENWFEEWQRWIDPGQPLSGAPSVSLGSNGIIDNYATCYPYDWDNNGGADECQPESGQLYLWHQTIQSIIDEFTALLEQPFVGAACGDPWCIPPRGCPEVSQYEELTFDVNLDGIDGTLEDVIACLNFNIHGYDYTNFLLPPDLAGLNPTTLFEGNDARYNACKLTCSEENCTNLPRTVVPPPYDPGAYVAADPLDEPDMALMLACVHSCSNLTCRGTIDGPATTPNHIPAFSPPDILAPPLTQTSSGAAYAYTGPDLDAFNELFDCTGNELNDNNGYRTLFRDSLVQANPVCDIAPGGWLAVTGTAALEAENQIDKFVLRRDYLDDIFNDLVVARNTMRVAANAFDDFLTDNVVSLIDARFAYDAAAGEKFPFNIVYGWQDLDAPESREGAVDGLGNPIKYWHVVKVEGRIPLRCDNACGVGGGADPKWPKVETYTKKAGLKRCYELFNTDGIVKFRVTRFDEAPRSQAGGLFFPNGQPIWKFRFFHPGDTREDVSARTLGSTCDPIMIQDDNSIYPAALVPPETFKGAFIMNQRIGTSGGGEIGNNYDCWNRAHFLLANSGVMSETCAQYYYKGGDHRGLTFSFIDCPGGF